MNPPHDPPPRFDAPRGETAPPSVDSALRAAGARQRRALAPAAPAADHTPATPAPVAPPVLRRNGHAAAWPPRPAPAARWRRALAAAAALALVAGGWWALRSSAPTAAPPAPPVVADTRPILDTVLGHAAPLTRTPAAALATELDRMQADLRRVLAGLPRLTLRWDTPKPDEPRTERAAPRRWGSA